MSHQHEFHQVIDPTVIAELSGDKTVGFDLGSRTSKAVLLADGTAHGHHSNRNLHAANRRQAIRPFAQAERLRPRANPVHRRHGLRTHCSGFRGDPFESRDRDPCHAMGTHFLNAKVKSIVDIGGQDSKAIKVDTRNGKVVEFIMNDKCAAGTETLSRKGRQSPWADGRGAWPGCPEC